MGRIIDALVWYSPYVLVYGIVVLLIIVLGVLIFKHERPTKYKLSRD